MRSRSAPRRSTGCPDRVGGRTRIKICGVSQPEDVDAAVEAGADAIGFNFYPPSPRGITPARAAELARRLPPFVTPVGVFVNATDAEFAAAVEAVPGLVLQFHGDETPERCAAVAAAWPIAAIGRQSPRRWLRALGMAPGVDLLDFARRFHEAEGFVLDAAVDGFGGGGKTFDWTLVPPDPTTLHTTRPHPTRSPAMLLSGGLTVANVAAGIAALRPYAVDVSSGVESSRGVKSAALIHAFCAAVRAADAAL